MTRNSSSPVAARKNPRAKAVFPAPKSPSKSMVPFKVDEFGREFLGGGGGGGGGRFK